MFSTKIDIIKNNLTESEKALAEFISSNWEKCRTITSMKLAQEAHVSQSSVIRFSQKLGYSSFRELLADVSNNRPESSLDREINIAENDTDTVKKIAAQEQEIIQQTLRINSSETLRKAVDLLRHCDSCICFGKDSSNLFAHYMANQLTKMGILSLTPDDDDTAAMMINNAKENVILFLISESGSTPEICRLAKMGRKKGVKVITMTRSYRTQIYDHSDIVLKTVAFERETRLNVSTMRVSQLFLIDALYLMIMKTDFVRYNTSVEQAEIITGKKKNIG